MIRIRDVELKLDAYHKEQAEKSDANYREWVEKLDANYRERAEKLDDKHREQLQIPITLVYAHMTDKLYVLEYYLTLTGSEIFNDWYSDNSHFKSVKEIFPRMGYISEKYFEYLLNKTLKRYEYITNARDGIGNDIDVIAVRDVKACKTNQEKKGLLEKVTKHYIYLPLEDSELKLFQYEYSIFFDSIYPQSAFRSLHSSNAHSDWVEYHRKQEKDNSEAIILQDAFLNKIDFDSSFGYQYKNEIYRNNNLYKIATNHNMVPTGDLDIDPYVITNDSIIVKKLDINDRAYINTHSFENGLFLERELRDKNYFTCKVSKNLKISFDDIYIDKNELIDLGVIKDPLTANLTVNQQRTEILLRLLQDFSSHLIDNNGCSLYSREELFKYIYENGENMNLSIRECSLFNLTKDSIKDFLKNNSDIASKIVFKKGRPKSL